MLNSGKYNALPSFVMNVKKILHLYKKKKKKEHEGKKKWFSDLKMGRCGQKPLVLKKASLVGISFSAGLFHSVHDLLHLIDGLHDMVLHHHGVVTLFGFGQQVIQLPQDALQLSV